MFQRWALRGETDLSGRTSTRPETHPIRFCLSAPNELTQGTRTRTVWYGLLLCDDMEAYEVRICTHRVGLTTPRCRMSGMAEAQPILAWILHLDPVSL